MNYRTRIFGLRKWFKISQWCGSNIGECAVDWNCHWVDGDEYEFRFKDLKHLTLFLLRWG
jgi:hypothetical protein